MFPTFYTNCPKMFYVSDSNETPGDRLRTIRERLKLSARKAASLTDPRVSHSTIGKIEMGVTPWENVQRNTIRGLARAYGLSPDQLIDEVNGTPYPSKPNLYTDQVHLETPDINQGRRRLEVIDLLSAGPGNDGGTVVGSVDLGDEFVGPHAAFRISGDSMAPEIYDRGTVIIRCQEYASPKNIIVCWTPEEGMLCKYLERVEDGYYVLTSVNPIYKPIWTREIHIYGIVVEARKPYKIINGNHS